MAETKICVDCKKEFSINESGNLIVPFFDMHSTTCEKCGKSLIIEYKEDGSIDYCCPGHITGSSSSQFYGYSRKYCPFCRKKRYEKYREERSVPCCICQQKKGFYLNSYHGYDLWGGGTAIRLFCGECEDAFLALPASRQAFYIRSRCNLAFPPGQVIYAMRDPESHLVRYIGRTHDLKKRFQRHLSERSNIPAILNEPYYSRPNWMYDLFSKGLRPLPPEVIREVEIAPMVIEWETRYILHGFQQGWPLTNIESAMETLIAQVKASRLDFLHCSFEDLVQEGFIHENGIEAFVRKFYR